MTHAFPFLLFINETEFHSGNSNKKARSSNKSPKGYAVFCPTSKCQHTNPRVNDALSKRGIQVIQNDRVTPPQNAKFEALEIIINTDSKGISIQCTRLNLEFVRRVFKRFSRIHENISLHEVKGAMINDSAVNLIERLLVPRADMPFRGSKTETLLHFAVERGCKALFELLLKCGADVNRVKSDGSTPLYAVVDEQYNMKHRLWFAQKLLEAGASVNVPTETGFTPLHKAVKKACIQVVRLLLKKGADVNVTTINGSTPLHVAAGIVNKKVGSVVSLLLQHGANVHAADSRGATPLMYFYRSPRILRLLIENGAAVDAQTKTGRTVLLETVENGCFESAKYILSLQPSVSVKGNRQAFYSALRGDFEEHTNLACRMFEQGFAASSDAADKPAVIFGAINKGLVEIVQHLLDNGVAVNQWHFDHLSGLLTPLHCAINSKRADVVRLLLERGADVNAYHNSQEWAYKTPLGFAVVYGSLEIVKMITEGKASDRKDPKLLFAAINNPRLEVLEFLLREGFDPNFKDEEGLSFFSFLHSRSPEVVIDTLTKYGAHLSYDHIKHDRVYTSKIMQAYLDHCPVDASASVLNMSNEETARHLLKLKLLVPEINVLNSSLNWKRRLIDFKEQCEFEAEKLAENIGNAHVTYRDILTKKVDCVACYARNVHITKAMEPSLVEYRFPIYASIINCKFRMGVWRKTLVDEAVLVLQRLFARFSRLPDEILEAIIRPLSNRDLVMLQKCLPAEESP